MKMSQYPNEPATTSADFLIMVDAETGQNRKVTLANLIYAGMIKTADLADGAVTSEKLSATIAARAYRSAAFSVTGGGGPEKLSLDAESFDTGSDFDVANGRFVAPKTGYYHVDACLRLSNVDIGSALVVYIYVNSVLTSFAVNYSEASADDPSVVVSDVVQADAGEFIEMYVDCSTTEAVSPGPDQTFMSIYFIGA